jgi:hypothetical protein
MPQGPVAWKPELFRLPGEENAVGEATVPFLSRRVLRLGHVLDMDGLVRQLERKLVTGVEMNVLSAVLNPWLTRERSVARLLEVGVGDLAQLCLALLDVVRDQGGCEFLATHFDDVVGETQRVLGEPLTKSMHARAGGAFAVLGQHFQFQNRVAGMLSHSLQHHVEVLTADATRALEEYESRAADAAEAVLTQFAKNLAGVRSRRMKELERTLRMAEKELAVLKGQENQYNRELQEWQEMVKDAKEKLAYAYAEFLRLHNTVLRDVSSTIHKKCGQAHASAGLFSECYLFNLEMKTGTGCDARVHIRGGRLVEQSPPYVHWAGRLRVAGWRTQFADGCVARRLLVPIAVNVFRRHLASCSHVVAA